MFSVASYVDLDSIHVAPHTFNFQKRITLAEANFYTQTRPEGAPPFVCVSILHHVHLVTLRTVTHPPRVGLRESRV